MIFKRIHTGNITCSDGVEIQLHGEYISYSKDSTSVRVEIGYTAFGKMIVYENRMEYEDPHSGDPVRVEIKTQVLDRIREVLNLLKIKYKVE